MNGERWGEWGERGVNGERRGGWGEKGWMGREEKS